jgi:hypothetical protein
MQKLILFLSLMAMIFSAHALKKMPAEQLQFEDLSGVYDCTGDDAHEGKYTGIVTMKLKPEHSHDSYASYDFKLEVPGYGTYLGHAAATDNVAAMHFALTDKTTKDYGTGIAKFKRNAEGKLSFRKFYFEPEYKGGNTGLEDCVKRD